MHISASEGIDSWGKERRIFMTFFNKNLEILKETIQRKSVFNRNWIRVQEFIFSNTQAKYKSLKISVRSSKGIKLLVLST